jgi:serine/threonine-protein kinase
LSVDLTDNKTPPPRVIAQTDDPMIGSTVAGRYHVEARLGEGGMGAVYRVEHTLMKKRLALKVLHREMTRQPEIVARFEREALAAAHIEHPNVAGATDFGKLEDGSCYLVLEYVEGTSLRACIDKGPLLASRAVHVAVQMLSALRRAHELGIVHRDLKPENVLLVDKDGDADFVKVLDFGIARVPIGSIGTSTGGESGPSLTRAGMVYGTPEYMAPEQALGQPVDGRSDLYSVGVMLFEMLTGRRPYDNKDKVALLGQHVAGPIPRVRERAPDAGISAEVEAIVTRLLSKSPSDRYSDAQAAADALLAIGTEPTSPISDPSADPGGDGGNLNSPFSLEPPQMREPRAFEIAATMPPPAGGSPLKKLLASPRLLAIAGGGVVLLIVVLVLALRRPSSADEDAAGQSGKTHTKTGATVTSANSGEPPPIASVVNGGDVKQDTQMALGRIASGEVEAGTKALEALAKRYPGDPFVLRSLAVSYSKQKRHLEALATLKQLLKVSTDAAADPGIDSVIDDALVATTPAGAADAAWSLLEKEMGGEGARILYDVAYGKRGPDSLRNRAQKSLADAEMQKKLTTPIRAAFELRSASGCTAKRAAIEKYRADFDARALPLLAPLRSTSGCGFLRNRDCLPCLREGKLLETVYKEVEDRTKTAEPAPSASGSK